MTDMLTAAARARRFQDKVALVTGVGTGTGCACALRLGLEGARVVIASRSAENVAHASGCLAAHDVAFRAVRADVGTEEGAAAAVAAALEAFGRLDVLVNTAGGYEGGGFEQTDAAALERMLAANLRTGFCAARAAAPEIAKGGGGAIVITTAVFGAVVPGPGLLAYNTSKTAATGLALGLAAELAPRNVRVNAILPGGISHRFDPTVDPARGRKLLTGPALPDDVAAAAAWLASDEACFVTGATLVLDGGFAVSRKPF